MQDNALIQINHLFSRGRGEDGKLTNIERLFYTRYCLCKSNLRPFFDEIVSSRLWANSKVSLLSTIWWTFQSIPVTLKEYSAKIIWRKICLFHFSRGYPVPSTLLTDSDINGSTARPTVWLQGVTACHLVRKEHVAQMPTWRPARPSGKALPDWLTNAEISLFSSRQVEKMSPVAGVNTRRSAQCRSVLASGLFIFLFFYSSVTTDEVDNMIMCVARQAVMRGARWPC